MQVNFQEIFTRDDKELVQWCVDAGILKKPHRCKVCRSRWNKFNEVRLAGAKAYIDKVAWRYKDRFCGGIQGIRNGNKLLEAFPRIKLKILLIYIFSHYCFMISNCISYRTLGLTPKMVAALVNYLSNWVVNHQIHNDTAQGPLGGPNRIVEIDESCFFKRKNNQGRVTNPIWVFGAVERGTGRLYVRVVDRRNADTLLPIIENFIFKDTDLVISDCWRAYQRLPSLGYHHASVNHSQNFVDPQNRHIHTQTIENRWGQMKSLLRKRGRFQD